MHLQSCECLGEDGAEAGTHSAHRIASHRVVLGPSPPPRSHGPAQPSAAGRDLVYKFI